MSAIMSAAVQNGGWASKLFSNALFCLWLSLASVMVWFDLGTAQAPATATSQPGVDAPAAPAGDAMPATGGAPDKA